MLARRLLVLAAVLLALGAVAASIAPRDLRGPRTAPSLPAPPPRAPAPSLPGRELALTVDADAARPPTVAARVGDDVRLSIRAPVTGALSIAVLDRTQAVDPYSPAIFDFVADRAGSFPVVLAGTAVRVATLRVTER
jgi:hypothetical protein